MQFVQAFREGRALAWRLFERSSLQGCTTLEMVRFTMVQVLKDRFGGGHFGGGHFGGGHFSWICYRICPICVTMRLCRLDDEFMPRVLYVYSIC